ncbi:MAG TPA: SH3 domain-containing protein [Candidatus Ozemobacteraceae bacterium]|nr:SH3 domain-containing protein [Candidatus Ozemobacteraceae bacterium]HQG28251.1 SH3 domain-containing protein [Candidatus Ozemobacteraceae bacterium]
MTKYIRLSVLVALGALLLFPTGSARAVDAGKSGRTMEFIDGEGNVRTGPNLRDKILFQPATGTRCLVVSEKGPWKEVKFDDGSTGWSHQKNLKAVEAASPDRVGAPSEDADGSVVSAISGGPDSYALSAAVLRRLEGKELDDLRRSFPCAAGDVYAIRLANDDLAILCAAEGRFSGKETFSLRVKTAGLHEIPWQKMDKETKKEKKEVGTRTVVVYEEAP